MTTKLITILISFITTFSLAQNNLETKIFPLDNFNKIVASGGGKLELKFSAKYTLQISATSDCFGLVDFSVSSKTLYIKMENPEKTKCTCTLEIGLPKLDTLIQNGGGSVVTRKGFAHANLFQCKIRGGGNMDVSSLSIDVVDATIEGGGTLIVNAREKLDANISGGGLIEYVGDPIVNSVVSHGGSVKKQ